MKITLEIIHAKLLNTGRQPSTIRSYIGSFKRVARDCFKITGDELINDRNKMLNYDKVIKYIWSDKLVGQNKKKTFVGFLDVAHMMCRTKELKPYRTELRAVYDFCKGDIITKGSDKFDKTYEKFNWDDLINKRNEIRKLLTKNYNPKLDVTYLVLSLYVLLPPLRPQDFVNAQVFEDIDHIDDDDIIDINYVDLENSQLVINNHKTIKGTGKRIVDIPEKLLKIINNFQKKSGSTWLIPSLKNSNDHMNITHFSQFFIRIFDPTGKLRVTPTFLRNLYVSNRLDDNNVTDADRRKDAKIMGHSTRIANITYGKLSKKTSHRRNKKIYYGSKTNKK